MYAFYVFMGMDWGRVCGCGWIFLGLHHRECGSRTYIDIFLI
jgi:hypothetical protein